MPIAREGVVSTALNGKLYAVGQLGSVRNLADLYDPGGDRWVPLPTLQCPRLTSTNSKIQWRYHTQVAPFSRRYAGAACSLCIWRIR